MDILDIFLLTHKNRREVVTLILRKNLIFKMIILNMFISIENIKRK